MEKSYTALSANNNEKIIPEEKHLLKEPWVVSNDYSIDYFYKLISLVRKLTKNEAVFIENAAEYTGAHLTDQYFYILKNKDAAILMEQTKLLFTKLIGSFSFNYEISGKEGTSFISCEINSHSNLDSSLIHFLQFLFKTLISNSSFSSVRITGTKNEEQIYRFDYECKR